MTSSGVSWGTRAVYRPQELARAVVRLNRPRLIAFGTDDPGPVVALGLALFSSALLRERDMSDLGCMPARDNVRRMTLSLRSRRVHSQPNTLAFGCGDRSRRTNCAAPPVRSARSISAAETAPFAVDPLIAGMPRLWVVDAVVEIRCVAQRYHRCERRRFPICQREGRGGQNDVGQRAKTVLKRTSTIVGHFFNAEG